MEHGSSHKDVTVVFNDGTKQINLDDDKGSEKFGCNIGKMRFHEDRDDFSVFNTSRLRMMMGENSFINEVDPESDNSWQTCINIKDVNKKLPKKWLEKAR